MAYRIFSIFLVACCLAFGAMPAFAFASMNVSIRNSAGKQHIEFLSSDTLYTVGIELDAVDMIELKTSPFIQLVDGSLTIDGQVHPFTSDHQYAVKGASSLYVQLQVNGDVYQQSSVYKERLKEALRQYYYETVGIEELVTARDAYVFSLPGSVSTRLVPSELGRTDDIEQEIIQLLAQPLALSMDVLAYRSGELLTSQPFYFDYQEKPSFVESTFPEPFLLQAQASVVSQNPIVQTSNGNFSVTFPEQDGGGTITGTALYTEEQMIITGLAESSETTITFLIEGDKYIQADVNAYGEWTAIVSSDEVDTELETIAFTLIVNDQEPITLGMLNGGIRVDDTYANDVKQQIQALHELTKQYYDSVLAFMIIVMLLAFLSSHILRGYAPLLPLLLQNHLLPGKKKEYSGIVYDSVTKEPVSGVFVQVKRASDNKKIKTAITNREGVYSVNLNQGQYVFAVHKPEYSFPSKIVTGNTDLHYKDVLHEHTSYTIKKGTERLPSIPIDQIEHSLLTELHDERWWHKGAELMSHAILPILAIGSVISLYLVFLDPSQITSWVICTFYLIGLWVMYVLRKDLFIAWGTVYDRKTNLVIPYAKIQLINKEFGLPASTRLTDKHGKYSFPDAKPGHYVVKVTKEGYEHRPEHRAGEELDIDSKHHPVTLHIPLESK